MLATDKQIKYLCALADKVEKIKAINKSAKVIKANLLNIYRLGKGKK